MEIVGLKKIVQDDVNRLISKFVGFKPHPVAELLQPLFDLYYFGFDAAGFLWYRKRCYKCNDRLDENEMDEKYRYMDYFKLCSYCFDDEYFCERCNQALTSDEREVEIRPITCGVCLEEEENESEEEM